MAAQVIGPVSKRGNFPLVCPFRGFHLTINIYYDSLDLTVTIFPRLRVSDEDRSHSHDNGCTDDGGGTAVEGRTPSGRLCPGYPTFP